jgi:Na+/proline symporter
MHLTSLDWAIVILSIVGSFIPALWMMRRAGRDTTEFFTSGRAAPWWLIGVSMVATTFSTDTPNLVANLVREGGIAANWVWWAYLLTGLTTVFFYARLWRRIGVLTDLEFYELRYSGRAATWVRGFRAVYLGLIFNMVIMASVNLAAAKIANVLLGWPMTQTLIVCSVLNVAFAATSGLWGVLVTDFIQFGIAMTGSVAAAVYALKRPEVGGLGGLVEKLDPGVMRMVPDLSNWEVALPIFIVPLAVQWWSTWYPGSEPGGGSYIAQRMLAARTERDALSGTLFFNLAHYAMRPWPWILVALASMLVFPSIDDIRAALPHVDPALLGNDMAYSAMLTFLPAGMLGLMVAGLLAAYVSTISTHLNWGTSYLVNDLYRRFMRPGETEQHYVLVGRLVTALLMIVAALFTLMLESARASFDLLLSVGAGTGLLYLLRWFWWRINAWSEIAAMVSSFALAAGLFIAQRRGAAIPSHVSLLLMVTTTTVIWIAIAFLTPQTDRRTLLAFYRLVRPAGPGWGSIREEVGGPASSDNLSAAFVGWIAGLALIYGALFGSGLLLLGRPAAGTVGVAVAVVGGIALVRLLPRLWASERPHAAAGPAE